MEGRVGGKHFGRAWAAGLIDMSSIVTGPVFVCKTCGITLGANAYWVDNGTNGPLCHRCAGVEFVSCPSCQGKQHRIDLLEEFMRAWDAFDRHARCGCADCDGNITAWREHQDRLEAAVDAARVNIGEVQK